MKERHILIISPMYQRWDYLARCMESVRAQNYDNYQHVVINDGSDDRPTDLAYFPNLGGKLVMFDMDHTGSAVRNQHMCLYNYTYGNDDSIVMLLDGDDSLVGNPEIFNFYNDMYTREDLDFTYGSMWSMADGIPLVAQPYPPDVIKNKKFREHRFAWNMPYTHLRTFRKGLFKQVKVEELKDKDGNFYKEGGDNAMFYALIEKARPDKIRAISDIVVNYNDVNPLNDYKREGNKQNETAEEILTYNTGTSFYLGSPGPVGSPAPGVIGSVNGSQSYDPVVSRLFELCNQRLLPIQMINYIEHMNGILNIKPKVVYDIGSCVLHWQREAAKIWPDADYYGFDALSKARAVHEAYGVPFCDVLLGSEDGKEINFYQNEFDPGGNSYYPENEEITSKFVTGSIKFEPVKKTMRTLQSIMVENGLPFPDLIKMDVQGAELDILKGYKETLGLVHDLIIEAQTTDFNLGAPKFEEVRKWLEEEGWTLVAQIDNTGNDGNYHFHNTQWEMGEKNQPPKAPDLYKLAASIRDDVPAPRDKRHILIATPTPTKMVEAEMMMGIYNMDIPEGVETEFRYSYGYQIDQVRNLIASWAVKEDFTHLLFVDADIVLPAHALRSMLDHNVDVCSGMYIQRIPNASIIELLKPDYTRFQNHDIQNGFQELGGCGMGCCLIRKEVLVDVGYPQFVYKSALDHKDTQPEDFYFCRAAREKGYRIWVDPSIKCSHIGKTVFNL